MKNTIKVAEERATGTSIVLVGQEKVYLGAVFVHNSVSPSTFGCFAPVLSGSRQVALLKTPTLES